MDSKNQKDAFEEIAEKEMLSSEVRTLAGIFIGLALVIILHAVWTMVAMLTDRSIPVVICPRTYELDAPVLMKTVGTDTLKSQDRWIRGFVRRYIQAQFPRTVADVKPSFSYVKNHSKGMVRRRYQALLNDSEEISRIVLMGMKYRFYPAGRESVRIRPENKDRWVVEVDGYLVKDMVAAQERETPTLRYIIEAGVPTIDNPEGLYVVETDVEKITDYVSGTKESL